MLFNKFMMLGAIILGFSFNAIAADRTLNCKVNGQDIRFRGLGVNFYVIDVDIASNIVKDENQIITIEMSCVSTASFPVFTLDGIFLKPALQNKDIEVWMNVNGVDYNLVNTATLNVRVLQMLTAGTIGTITPMKVYFKLKNNPTKELSIKKGDDLAEISMSTSLGGSWSCDVCGPFPLRLRANSDAFVPTNSCKFQNGESSDVNFGTFRPNQLSTSITASSQLRQTAVLSYSCDDPTATVDIAVRVNGETSSFSSDLIKTSNKDLGIAVLHNNVQVLPGRTFQQRILNGSGSTTLSFVPIKNAVSNDDFELGQWSGSVSFIMTLP